MIVTGCRPVSVCLSDTQSELCFVWISGFTALGINLHNTDLLSSDMIWNILDGYRPFWPQAPKLDQKDLLTWVRSADQSHLLLSSSSRNFYQQGRKSSDSQCLNRSNETLGVRKLSSGERQIFDMQTVLPFTRLLPAVITCGHQLRYLCIFFSTSDKTTICLALTDVN